MPKTVPKFKEPLIFWYYIHARPELGEIKWQWSDQRKQFWEDWIPKDKDLIIHTKLSADHEQLFRDAFWQDMEDEIRNTKDSLNFRARQRRAKKKVTANQGSHPSP